MVTRTNNGYSFIVYVKTMMPMLSGTHNPEKVRCDNLGFGDEGGDVSCEDLVPAG